MGPNENHGTYEFFYEKILDKQDLVEGVNLQQDYSTLVILYQKIKMALHSLDTVTMKATKIS